VVVLIATQLAPACRQVQTGTASVTESSPVSHSRDLNVTLAREIHENIHGENPMPPVGLPSFGG